MGKTPERRVFTSSGALRYRRKVPAPADNQQSEQPEQSEQPQSTDVKREQADPKQQQQQLEPQQRTARRKSTSSRLPPGRRFQSNPRQPKPQQPALLKQLLWKAKAVQPTSAALVLVQQQCDGSSNNNNDDEEEDEEVAFAKEQRQACKLLASEAEALAASKTKAVRAALPLSDPFVAESSSQETQSGSEDEAVFLPYSGLLPAVQPPVEWQVFKDQEDGAGSETDREEISCPVVPSETVEPTQEQTRQDGLEKEATRRKQRPKYKLKQKQKVKRAAAKEQKQLQYRQKQEESERSCPAGEDAGSTQGQDSTTVDIFHPATNLASEMDAGVCRAVLSQLKDVVPFIVVGDVVCPMVANDQRPVTAGGNESDQRESKEAVVDFRQHVIAMLDRSKETQILYRESFVVENSGFDAASSYDFFKNRFCEIQRNAGIVYY